MQIDALIERLIRVRDEHGNIEVTCTGSTLFDDEPAPAGAVVFETTVETLVVNANHPTHGKAVRLWL